MLFGFVGRESRLEVDNYLTLELFLYLERWSGVIHVLYGSNVEELGATAYELLSEPLGLRTRLELPSLCLAEIGLNERAQTKGVNFERGHVPLALEPL